MKTKSENQEFEKFDGAMRKILTVSYDELQRREKQWKQKRAKKKARREKNP
jgi:hypothetical protein